MRALPVEPRLLANRTITETGCWVWTGYVRGGTGYGQISVNHKPCKVHRVAYELWKGPIPQGLDVAHECRNRLCFNPDHLKAQTRQQNVQHSPPYSTHPEKRKTHCTHGHPLTEDNVYVYKGNRRHCKTCVNNRAKERWRNQR